MGLVRISFKNAANAISVSFVNRGYWDPSESMRTLAEEIVANDPTKLPAGETEVTQENYFRIASLERLGTEQTAQFQSGDQYGSGWHWGSKCSSNGACDNAPTTNGFARMPRSYSDVSTGSFYNFYAATAGAANGETGVSVVVADSLCPSGWQLPASDSDSIIDFSYSNLLFSASTYNLSNNSDSSERMRAVPMFFSLEGIYNQSSGAMGGRNIEGYFWSSYSVSTSNGQSLRLNQTEISALNGNQKAHGFSIRCVRRNN